MKKLILLFGLLIVCASITFASFAWLTDTDAKTVTYTVGDVEYTLTTSTQTSTLVVPGVDLLNGIFTLTNTSTVTSDIRIKIEIESNDAIIIDHFIITTTESADTSTNSGYYTISNLAASSGAVTLPFTSVMLDGTKVGNDFTGKSFTIKVTFEAKQHDGVDWNTLTTQNINFETGLARA